MKGKLFAFVPAIVVVTAFTIFYVLAYFRIQQNLSNIRQSETTTVVNSAKAKIKSKKDELRLLGQELENEKKVGRTYLMTPKLLGGELREVERKHKIDIADVIDDTNGRAARFKELSSAKIVSAYKKFTHGFLVQDIEGKLALLSFGPLKVETVPQGILLLGYYVNDTIATQVSSDTNSNTRFAEAGDYSLNVETYGGASVVLGLLIESQYSSSVNRSTLVTIALLGLLALALISGLIHVYTKRIRRQALKESFAKFMEGVVHDLKSSLRALSNSLCEKDLPGVERAVTDIHAVLGLVREKRQGLIEEEEKNEPFEPQMLALLCGEAIRQAKWQYRDRPEIDFECEFNSDSYGVFAKVQRTRFLKRVLPNIISNAAESISGSGIVAIRVDRDGDHAVVRVIDNGCGIPADILPRICERGFTFGKAGGSGIGLTQVKTAISSWGGALDFISDRPGTVVYIRLPLVETPSWLISRLEISEDDKVIVLDDDPSIHNAWRERLERGFGSSFLNNVSCFTSTTELTRSGLAYKNCLFLCDYHLAEENGIDVVKALGVEAQAIIVSHLEGEAIIKECRKHGLRLMPKELISEISISLKPKAGRSSA